jgi:hypothetical protein
MRRINVNSSLIRSVGYNAVSQILEIEFQSGAVYQYQNVPKIEYDELMRADSHDSYFNQEIKGAYLYFRVS